MGLLPWGEGLLKVAEGVEEGVRHGPETPGPLRGPQKPLLVGPMDLGKGPPLSPGEEAAQGPRLLLVISQEEELVTGVEGHEAGEVLHPPKPGQGEDAGEEVGPDARVGEPPLVLLGKEGEGLLHRLGEKPGAFPHHPAPSAWA